MAIDPNKFLHAVGVRPKKDGDGGSAFSLKLAIVDASYTGSGRPRLIFAEDDAASTRTYNKAKGLVLAPGDRVLVAMVGQGGGGVVLCIVE